MEDAQLKAMFDQMDLDGDGHLSLEDLEVALGQLGLDVDASSLMAKLDTSGSGAVTFEDFCIGVREQGIFGGFDDDEYEDSYELDMSGNGEDEDDDNIDLVQEICENLRTDKQGNVSFTELERSISLCIGHLLGNDDRDKMIKAFTDIERDRGKGVSLDDVGAVLREWMNGSHHGNNDQYNNNNNNDDDDDNDDNDDDNNNSDAVETFESHVSMHRKPSLHGATSFFSDDGDEASQIYQEMEREVTVLRKKLATTAQDSMRYKQQLQVMQQEHHELEAKDKESRFSVVRLQRKLKDVESKLNRALEEELSLKGTVVTLEQGLARKAKEINALSNKIKSWKTKETKIVSQTSQGEPLTPRSSQIHELQKQSDNEERQRKVLQSQINELQNELDEARTEHRAVVTKHEILKITMKQVHARHEVQEKEILELKETIATLNHTLEQRQRRASTNEAHSLQVNEWIVHDSANKQGLGGEEVDLGISLPLDGDLSPIGGPDISLLRTPGANGTGRRNRVQYDVGMMSLALDLPIDMTVDNGGNALLDDNLEAQLGQGITAEEAAKLRAEFDEELNELRDEFEDEIATATKEKTRLEIEMKMNARRTARAHEQEKREYAAKLKQEVQDREHELEARHETHVATLRQELQEATAASSTAKSDDAESSIVTRMEIEMKMNARRTTRAHEQEKREYAAKLKQEVQDREHELEARHETHVATLRQELQEATAASSTAKSDDAESSIVTRMEIEMKMNARRTARAHEQEKREYAAKLKQEVQDRERKLEARHETHVATLRQELQEATAASSTAKSNDAGSLIADSGPKSKDNSETADIKYAQREKKLHTEVEVLKASLEKKSCEVSKFTELHEQTILTFKREAETMKNELNEARATTSPNAMSRKEDNVATDVDNEQSNSTALQFFKEKAKKLREQLVAAQNEKNVLEEKLKAQYLTNRIRAHSIFQHPLVPWEDDKKHGEVGTANDIQTPPSPPRTKKPSLVHKQPSVESPTKIDSNSAKNDFVKNAFRRIVAPDSGKSDSSVKGEAEKVSRRRAGSRVRRSKVKIRRRSNLYGIHVATMPEDHKPMHKGGLQRFLKAKLALASLQKSKLVRRVAVEGAQSTGLRVSLETATYDESFASQACAQVGSFKGDYRGIEKNISLQNKMREKGMEPDEKIVFSTVLHRCVPAFLFFSTKKKRTLIITTKAIYECDNAISFSVRRRLVFHDLNCISLSTAAADVFAVLPKRQDLYDLLYQTMRRTEVLAHLSQCYEAEMGSPLKIRYMKSIILTMENGDMKTTYVDESDANVKMEDYKPAVASVNQGFICPICRQKFATAPKLMKHNQNCKQKK